MLKDKIIKTIIKNKKSINLEDYINICLYDKEGYYSKKNPIGNNGDFITSPEISQLFGEILGIYIYLIWKNNFSSKFSLIELGPGKATLINDILRITKNFPDFFNNLNIILIEKNSKFTIEQKQKLLNKNLKIKWIKDFKISSKLPKIIYANEFFDCLPIRQFFKKNGIWFEKVINFNHEEQNLFIQNIKVEDKKKLLFLEKQNDGDLIEISEEREKYFDKLCNHIKLVKGIIIIIDYGYIEKPTRFTLQSIFKHKRSNILENIGNQDITSLIDFKKLINIAKKNKLKIISFSNQKDFLIKNGIKERKNKILVNCNDMQKKIIENGYSRIINDEMGLSFKVLVVASE